MSAPLAPTFAALADPTRWAILTRLGRQGAASATALAEELPVSRQAVAKHLAVLRATGLVAVTAAAPSREVRHRVVGARLSEVGRDLEQIGAEWEQQLARIKELAEAPQE